MRFGNFNPANVIGGLLFAAIGLFASALAATYPLGHLNRMGPGYLPLALGVILTALGIGIVFQGRSTPAQLPALQLRALLAIAMAIIGFGLVSVHFGLIPAAFVVVILSSLADPRLRPVTAILTASGLALFAYLVFIQGLGISMRPFHWG